MNVLATASGLPHLTHRIEWAAQWSLWQQLGVAAVALTVVALTAYNYRGLRPRRRWAGMLALRLTGVALLLAVFYQPTLVEEEVQHTHDTVAVLLDDSQSMGLPGAGNRPRSALVEEWMNDPDAVATLAGEHASVAWYAYGNALRPLGAKDSLRNALHQADDHTDLATALETLADADEHDRLGAVVVVSDGIDNGPLAERVGHADHVDRTTRTLLERLGVPVWWMRVPLDDVEDLAVADIHFPPFAFRKNATKADAIIEATGIPAGTQVSVTLYGDGSPVTVQRFRVTEGKHRYTVSFDFVPRTLGDHVYSVVVDPAAGESYLVNNERDTVLHVVRDRLRVLQICGHPSWDERFLRNFLKRNPNVDLISFFILINPRNAFAVSLIPGETTLIPFPARDLFVEELGSFDVIIFQDFNYGPFQTGQHLWRIRDFVKRGGAFIMIGGSRSFTEGDYYGTELTDILPVELLPKKGEGATLDTSRFHPRLTRAGQTHPITRLEPGRADNERLWADLPKLEGINRVARLKPGAIALLEHPRIRTDDGKPAPVVAVGEAGEGRVLAVMTDSTWRWSFVRGAHGGTSDAYSEFWTAAIRWLLRDPDLNWVRLRLARSENPLGQPIEVGVSVVGPDSKPARGVSVELSVEYRGSVRGWATPEHVGRHQGTTDSGGQWIVQLHPDRPGVYELTAHAQVAGRPVEARQLFVVTEGGPERWQLVETHSPYEAVAADSGGGKLTLGDAAARLAVKRPDALQVVRRQEHPLWSSAWVLMAAVLLFGFEWWLRRRMGYL